MSARNLAAATGMSARSWHRWVSDGVVPPPNRGSDTGARYTKPLYDELVNWFTQEVERFQGKRSQGKRFTFRVQTPFHMWVTSRGTGTSTLAL
jgi:hypothetical protein